MLRPVGVYLVMFALLCLIVHQIGMFELIAALATALLAADVIIARYSKTRHQDDPFREPLL
jgi:hypothetical protein